MNQGEPLPVAQDPRGLVFEPVGAGELALQKNVHVVFTRPGHVRGNHLHRQGTEILVVAGPALVRVREGDGTRDCRVEAGEVRRFVFPPGVAHAILNTGTEMGVVVSFNTHPHDPAHPDVFRDVLIQP